MRIAALAAVAALALSTPTHALDIYHNNGGLVFNMARQLHHTKRIRIMGTCASACTAALNNPRTCVGPNARLIFHAPYGAGRHNARIKQWLMGLYPASVRSWIRSQGGLTARPITLSGAELSKRVRRC